jgi:hypothetical protein
LEGLVKRIVSAAIFLSLLATPLFAQVARIKQPVDNSAVVRVPRTTHPLAIAANDRGRVQANLPMNRMLLLLQPSPEQQASMRQLLDRQHNPDSPAFHRWLTPEEFGAQFGPHESDLQQVNGWLKQQGFSVNAISRGRQWVEFSGTAAQVEQAFHTPMHNFSVRGEAHVANTTDISIPAALSPVVAGVVSLHNFEKKGNHGLLRGVHRDDKTGRLVPDLTLSNPQGQFVHYLAPGDFTRIYNTLPLGQNGIDGKGISIAVIGRSNLLYSDIETFRQIFNLPFNDPITITNGPDPGLTGSFVEALLDVEWAGAIAPKATIKYVQSASTFTSDGTDLSTAYAVDHVLAPIISSSYGLCEAFLLTTGNAFQNAVHQQAAAEGISVFVSSGDNGVAGCDFPGQGFPAINGANVSGLASTPYNTAVGGTQFNENGLDGLYWNSINNPDHSSAIGYIPEAIWNESCDASTDPNQCFGQGTSLWSSSGGRSSCTNSIFDPNANTITCISGYDKPSWQAGRGVPADHARDIPDLSFTAAGHDGYLVCAVGSCQTAFVNGHTVLTSASVIGGTSASTPAMAGVMALLEQKNGAYQGLANYRFYQLAAADKVGSCNSSNFTNPTAKSSCVFYDTTAGNNSVPGQKGYSAHGGYDLASGLGSVNAENLVNSWFAAKRLNSVTKMSASTNTFRHGDPIPLSVSVKPASGTGTPSGEFSLATDKFGARMGGTLINGAFSGPVNELPGGLYTLSARYAGDGMFAPSSSTPIAVNVAPEPSVVNVQGFYLNLANDPTPLDQPVFYGQPVGLQVDVQGHSGVGRATGKVTIFQDTKPVGTFPLAAGGTGFYPANPLTTDGLLVGPHHITVKYEGDSSFQPAYSAPLFVSVTKGHSATRSVAMPFDVAEGQTVKVYAMVSALDAAASTNAGGLVPGLVSPTGTMQIYDKGKPLSGKLPLQLNGYFGSGVPQVAFNTSLTGTGTHELSVAYSGDSNWQARPPALGPFSGPAFVNVTPKPKNPPVLTLQQTPSTLHVGQSANYVITVRPATPGGPMPTGDVSVPSIFLNDGASPTATLVNGNATFVVPWFFSGQQILYVQYLGDAHYSGVTSAPVKIFVNPATPTIVLTTPFTTLKAGTQTSFTLTLPGTSANPNIQDPVWEGGQGIFFDSVNGGAPHALTAPIQFDYGQANVPILTVPVFLGPGTHVITGRFLGTLEWAPVTSSPVSVVVQ